MGYKNVKKEWPDCDLQTCRLNDKTPPERGTRRGFGKKFAIFSAQLNYVGKDTFIGSVVSLLSRGT